MSDLYFEIIGYDNNSSQNLNLNFINIIKSISK